MAHYGLNEKGDLVRAAPDASATCVHISCHEKLTYDTKLQSWAPHECKTMSTDDTITVVAKEILRSTFQTGRDNRWTIYYQCRTCSKFGTHYRNFKPYQVRYFSPNEKGDICEIQLVKQPESTERDVWLDVGCKPTSATHTLHPVQIINQYEQKKTGLTSSTPWLCETCIAFDAQKQEEAKVRESKAKSAKSRASSDKKKNRPCKGCQVWQNMDTMKEVQVPKHQYGNFGFVCSDCQVPCPVCKKETLASILETNVGQCLACTNPVDNQRKPCSVPGCTGTTPVKYDKCYKCNQNGASASSGNGGEEVTQNENHVV